MPFIVYILGVGFVIAAVASTVHNALNARTDRKGFSSYLVFSLTGSLLGAFLALGDAPFLLRYPIFNPMTLSVVGSLVLTGLAVAMTTRRRRMRRGGNRNDGLPPPIFKK